MNTRDDPGATNPLKPTCVGFAVEMMWPRQFRQLRSLVKDHLGREWRVRRFGDNLTDFEVTGPAARLSVREAWDVSYRLRAEPGVAYAEPIFEVSLIDPEEYAAPPIDRAGIDAQEALGGLCNEPAPLDESKDPEWSLKLVHIFDAWQQFFPEPELPGTGIVVGHPDTGYTEHPEILGNLLIDQGYDFVQDDADAEDELDEGLLLQPGHGTGTASVIVSPRGAPANAASGNAVTGVAPGAKLIPIRTARSVVVLLNTFDLAHSIEHAANKGAHVISMSMGGILSWRLRQAVRYAQKRGVIVLAAAGNCVRFVVWPAAYDEVIAVAACNARSAIWRGSSRGRAVDVVAPGESVWKATVDPEDDTGGYGVKRGSGTSFAVATVAGVAALWLARHGRQQLVERYGLEKIPFVFNALLRQTCDPVPGWDPKQFGGGLVNAQKLLSAELPRNVLAPAVALQEHVPVDNGGLDTFAHLFDRTLTNEASARDAGQYDAATVLEAALAELLHTSEVQTTSQLYAIGQELAFHFAVNPALHKQFEAIIAAKSSIDNRNESFQVDGGRANLEAVRGTLLVEGASAPLLKALS